MGALSAAVVPATFDSSAYLGALLKERTECRMPRDRDPANEAFRRAVRERVTARRRTLGLSRDHMARAISDRGVSLSTQAYAKWEREAVPLDRLTDLADVLEVSPDWILHGDAPQLAELRAHLEQLTAQMESLQRLVVPPAPGRETRNRRSA